MNKLLVSLLIIGYCLIGVFIAGFVDDIDRGPDLLVVVLGPIMLLLLIPIWIIVDVYTLGKKLGDMFWRWL